ncbi:hypothetical protein ACFV2X_38450 [Streptomyces sp. NPDC059679]|uniref:hypothetical protein n=1 Tax=Streptomyces sp. NPDC059679 TaxID=3346903 RepID=UPI003676B333
MKDRTRALSVTTRGELRLTATASQPDEFLRRARAADAAKPNVPAGQLPATVTEAFIRLVALLDQRTAGGLALDVVVRDRVTGETAGVLPVTEDMAVALLAAFCDTVSAVRPAGEHFRTADTAPARPALSVLPGGVA